MRRDTDPTTRAVLTISELNELLGGNRAATYARAQAGTLPVSTFRDGRKILVRRDEVERLLGKDAVERLLSRRCSAGMVEAA